VFELGTIYFAKLNTVVKVDFVLEMKHQAYIVMMYLLTYSL